MKYKVLFVIITLLVLSGCSRSAWTIYPIEKEGITCDDFLEDYRVIARWTCNEQEYCNEHSDGEDCCYVDIWRDFKANKEYCNFTAGDNIYATNEIQEG